MSTERLPEASDLTNPEEVKPRVVRAEVVDVLVSRVALDGIVVPFTEVTFGKEVVADVIKVALRGTLVPLTVVRFGSEVVEVVTKVEDEGMVVPLMDEAVATPSEGVVKLGLTNGA